MNATDADTIPRVVVLGFDGLDPKILDEYVRAGDMPACLALRERGGVHEFQSEIPPESPVAWASVLTGVNPGRHGIFDFVARDPDTTGYKPVNAMVRVKPPRFLAGKIPFRPPLVVSRLAYATFLERVRAAGYPVLAIRPPLLFPAPDVPGARMLTGLGTPDLAGSNGLYALYDSGFGLGSEYTVFDGHRIHLSGGEKARVFESYLEGPFDPTGRAEDGGKRRITVPLRFSRSEDGATVTVEVGGLRETVPAGGSTSWLAVPFVVPSLPEKTLSGRVRFEVLEARDRLLVITSPIQIDPLDPALPISTPPGFSAELERRYGSFKTTGWMEETFQLNDRSIGEDRFLADLLLDMDRDRGILLGEMARGGRCVFHVFTQTDRASHCFFWRRDRAHPAYDADAARRLPDPLREVYRRMDAIVGEVASRLEPNDLLLVVSDHGFQSWRRGVNVNQWLLDNHYMVADDAPVKNLHEFFGDRLSVEVDWSKTRAYALGLGQIYLNLKGREPEGIVDPAGADALAEEIATKLSALRDTDGKAPLAKIYQMRDLYHGKETPHAAELQLAFAEGYRVSWQTALLGGMRRAGPVFEDNTFAWSGDHCSTLRDLVPGVLMVNRPLPPAPAGKPYGVRDVAPTVLRHFHVDASDLDGVPLPIDDPAARSR